jgi:hypothetical protein
MKNSMKLYKIKYVIDNQPDEMMLLGNNETDVKNQLTTFFKILGNKIDKSKIVIEEVIIKNN